jgi:hypothetical protein
MEKDIIQEVIFNLGDSCSLKVLIDIMSKIDQSKYSKIFIYANDDGDNYNPLEIKIIGEREESDEEFKIRKDKLKKENKEYKEKQIEQLKYEKQKVEKKLNKLIGKNKNA